MAARTTASDTPALRELGHAFSGFNISGNAHVHLGDNSSLDPSSARSDDEIHRICLNSLQCPDSWVVKSRLKEKKDKLLQDAISWVLQDSKYRRWLEGDDVCLLWIKGGAGKGKTMMSIGLIEKLLESVTVPEGVSTAVTFFFCQNADYELNTVRSIIKGLIRRLFEEREEVRPLVRRLWDDTNRKLQERAVSLQDLWELFEQMLERCRCHRVYIIVDALDECHQEEMANLLKLIVRNGLNQGSRAKWLLTSRPLDTANRLLLAGHEQLQVSLDLESAQVSEGIKTYISYKVGELDRMHRYGPALRQEVQRRLVAKAEYTFMWVSMACRQLEDTDASRALRAIEEFPSGLPALYSRAFCDLRQGHPTVIQACMRLLQVMMLVFRPLKLEELESVAGLCHEDRIGHDTVDHCASFIVMRGDSIEFVHQSARDFLAEVGREDWSSPHGNFGHVDVALNALSFLTDHLRVNLLDLPWPETESSFTEALLELRGSNALTRLDYAATFWGQHMCEAEALGLGETFAESVRRAETFLTSRFLEWLECLSLLNKIEVGIKALKVLGELLNVQEETDLRSMALLVQDALRFTARYGEIMFRSPLELYSYAIVFSPDDSLIKKANFQKLVPWVIEAPSMEAEWSPLVQQIFGHRHVINAVALSPDGEQIASGGRGSTLKLWSMTAGEEQRTLQGHSGEVCAVAFSPKGEQIVSGGNDGTVRLWSIATGEEQKTLEGHSCGVRAVAFSPDGRRIASGGQDHIVKVWSTATDEAQKTLRGHEGEINVVTFSPDDGRIVSGSKDGAVRLWSTATGEQLKVVSRSYVAEAIAFLPDGQWIALGVPCEHAWRMKWEETEVLLDHENGKHPRKLPAPANTMALSPDGQLAATSGGGIKLWDTGTGELLRTLTEMGPLPTASLFLLDNRLMAAGTIFGSVQLWDIGVTKVHKVSQGHSSSVLDSIFSPHGELIASSSRGEGAVILWRATTGEYWKKLGNDGEYYQTLAFSPDSKVLAAATAPGQAKVYLWDIATGQLQATLTSGQVGDVNIRAMALSSHGETIALAPFEAGRSASIRLFDSANGKQRKVLRASNISWSSYMCITFSPNGKLVATSSFEDGKVRLWDLQRHGRNSVIDKFIPQSCFTSFSTNGWAQSLRFSADSRTLITDLGSFDVGDPGEQRKAVLPIEGRPSLQLLRDENWIMFGHLRVLRLPFDSMRAFDVLDDRVVVGCYDGSVWRFRFDRALLQAHYDSRQATSSSEGRNNAVRLAK